MKCPYCASDFEPDGPLCPICREPLEAPAAAVRAPAAIRRRPRIAVTRTTALPGPIIGVIVINIIFVIFGLLGIVAIAQPQRGEGSTANWAHDEEPRIKETRTAIQFFRVISIASQSAVILALGISTIGLIGRKRWGWWMATLSYTALAALTLVGVALSVLMTAALASSGASMGGCLVMGAVALLLVCTLPLSLLLSARKRY